MTIFMNFRSIFSSWALFTLIYLDRIVHMIILILKITNLAKTALIYRFIEKFSSTTSSTWNIILIGRKLYRIWMIFVTYHWKLPVVLKISLLSFRITVAIFKRIINFFARFSLFTLNYSIRARLWIKVTRTF